MNVLIIGAGPSGLVTMKELLAEGHTITCFERRDGIGGVFRYSERETGVYRSCKLTSSTAVTAFSDAPFDPSAPHFLHHDEYLRYLEAYADRFSLKKHIRFGWEVKSLCHLDNGMWKVVVCHTHTKSTRKQIFDAVAISSGVHQCPNIPHFKNQEKFKGTICHSFSYKAPDQFAGKKVVVVGGGESASELVREISAVADECHLSLRRGVRVLPRFVNGLPNDYLTNRLTYSVPNWLFLSSKPAKRVWRNRLLYSPIVYPILLLWFVLVELETRAKALFATSKSKIVSPSTIRATIRTLMKASNAGSTDQFATKSEAFVAALADGSCTLRPGIRDFREHGVVFVDGTEVQADAVLLCTGYEVSLPFLSRSEFDGRAQYLNCFDPRIGKTLSFIGIVRPALGSIPPIAEMQARWFALLCSGKVELPNVDEMVREIDDTRRETESKFDVVIDRLNYLVDYTSYMDRLAEKIGCKPSFNDLLRHPVLMYKLYCGPFSAAQYRLRGPHSTRTLALHTILENRVTRGFVTNFVLGTCLFLCNMLAALGFDAVKPHLTLASQRPQREL